MVIWRAILFCVLWGVAMQTVAIKHKPEADLPDEWYMDEPECDGWQVVVQIHRPTMPFEVTLEAARSLSREGHEEDAESVDERSWTEIARLVVLHPYTVSKEEGNFRDWYQKVQIDDYHGDGDGGLAFVRFRLMVGGRTLAYSKVVSFCEE